MKNHVHPFNRSIKSCIFDSALGSSLKLPLKTFHLIVKTDWMPETCIMVEQPNKH